MRESIQRVRGRWRFNVSEISVAQTEAAQSATPTFVRAILQVSRFGIALLTVLLVVPCVVLAQQSPWERAATNLEQTFTGPLARSLALVAIVIGGLMFMFGEAGAKRQISGIVFGGGLALFAAQFLTWLF